jgi:hypothetical protein
MADYGVSILWGANRPGREQTALAVFADAMAHAEKAKADGRIAEYDAVLFEAAGDFPAGVFTLWGTQEQLKEVIFDEERQAILFRAELCTERVTQVMSVRGEAVAAGIGLYQAAVDQVTRG